MVEVCGRPIIEYTLSAFDSVEEEFNINLVSGYCSEALANLHYNKIHNEKYASTNMLFSLWRGLDTLQKNNSDRELIVCYGDIIFDPLIMVELIKQKHDIVLPSNSNWKSQWSNRYKDPLEDLETFKFDELGYLTEIGNEPKNYNDIDGQYMGIIKFSKMAGISLKVELEKMFLDNFNNFHNIHLTRYLQMQIDKGTRINVMSTSEYWFEIDNISDLKYAEDNLKI